MLVFDKGQNYYYNYYYYSKTVATCCINSQTRFQINIFFIYLITPLVCWCTPPLNFFF